MELFKSTGLDDDFTEELTTSGFLSILVSTLLAILTTVSSFDGL